MKIDAHAKINLGLDVIRRRDDGYHEVRMIMQTVGLHDELLIDRTDEPGIHITVNKDDLPVNGDNLIYRAGKLMMDEYGLTGGITVELTKNIPVAAGLAGGSTDAAAVLRAVNTLWDLGLSQDELKRLGVRIGADVPYCIMGGTVMAEGIGEKLTKLEACPKWRVLLAKPPVGVSTAHVYGSLNLESVTHPDIDKIAEGVTKGDLHTVVRYMGNVLESVTEAEVPQIGYIKSIIKESGYPLMSGSGPTVFGLFESDEAVNRAYEDIKKTGYAADLIITQTYDPNEQVD
ncbi:MAG: 4-(cytidine 5'-diphospho)-2-C-methyl-D-erythritol kinase [Lachnospiraceae bacterium]|nr:4-(cytidine 5'-diphospho)-2-C-methyl-D-erythritol kinase [Lachnospiraceae bacterium]